jgi:EGF-like domain
MYGSTCHLIHVQCQSQPCKNNGTCSPTSTPGRFICHCQPRYHGSTCAEERDLVQLYITHNVEHRAAVLQYFDVDLSELNLVLLYQHVVRQIPDTFSHLNTATDFAELAVVKVYTDVLVGIYLIALHVNRRYINGSAEINEQTRCIPVQDLFNKTEKITPLKYHKPCRSNRSLLCFYDERYLCICETNHSRADCFGYDHSLYQCSR